MRAGGPYGTCRSCRAPIVWGTTQAGKAIPLDREPTPDGTVVVAQIAEEGTSLERWQVRVLRAGEQPHPDRLRYTSHFSTCPHAAEHRRPR